MTQSQPTGGSTGSGIWKWLGIGCVGLLIIGAAGTFWAVKNFRPLASKAMEKMVDTTLDDMNIPEESALEIRETVHEVTDAFRSGEIDGGEVRAFIEGLAMNPVLTIGLGVYVFESRLFPQSGLSEEEKQAAVLNCQRLLRGLDTGAITGDEAEEVFDSVGDYRSVMGDDLSDDDLRTVAAAMAELVDEKAVPAEPYAVDFGGELREAVDAVLH